jgi:putative tryptophan/tyrosine transport system substrate-binding protein
VAASDAGAGAFACTRGARISTIAIRKLQEHGYVQGQNLHLQSRFAEGHDERYPGLAAELVKLPVDVIVTWAPRRQVAAKDATTAIPIVMGAVGDPVSVGIVSNLARPGGNITGFATQNVDLEGKRLELLKDLLPHLSRVGVLANATNPIAHSYPATATTCGGSAAGDHRCWGQ